MDVRKRYRRILIGILVLSLTVLGGMLYIQEKEKSIPDEITVFAGESLSEEYKLFGLIPIKSVSVNVVERQVVIPCGVPVGIYVETDGVLVLGTQEVTTVDGSVISPSASILKEGDYITAINGVEVQRKSELTEALNASGGEEVILDVRRNSENIQVRIQPAQIADGEYRLGIWVRNNTQGIGMVTYLTTDGRFGAIGHGISDADTGELMETARGLLYNTTILSIVPGQENAPGELIGYIDYHVENVVGTVDANLSSGLFGTAGEALLEQVSADPVQICLKQDIETGPAVILTSINGEAEEYEVEILAVNLGEEDENKGIILQVTDERLLKTTGGIVQGMSGSPILQNGKIIGAVTHVFVKDATKGFGIFIENMLEADKEHEDS